MAVMRRTIRISAIVQLVYICIRTLWHSIPFLTGGEPGTASVVLSCTQLASRRLLLRARSCCGQAQHRVVCLRL